MDGSHVGPQLVGNADFGAAGVRRALTGLVVVVELDRETARRELDAYVWRSHEVLAARGPARNHRHVRMRSEALVGFAVLYRRVAVIEQPMVQDRAVIDDRPRADRSEERRV